MNQRIHSTFSILFEKQTHTLNVYVEDNKMIVHKSYVESKMALINSVYNTL